MELQFVKSYLEFTGKDATINSNLMVTCTDEHLTKAVCLAHSLLKLSSLLDSRLKVRSHVLGGNAISAKETLSNTALVWVISPPCLPAVVFLFISSSSSLSLLFFLFLVILFSLLSLLFFLHVFLVRVGDDDESLSSADDDDDAIVGVVIVDTMDCN